MNCEDRLPESENKDWNVLAEFRTPDKWNKLLCQLVEGEEGKAIMLKIKGDPHYYFLPLNELNQI